MKERPILFSAPMVRAILAGTKTQTRRLVKPQHILNAGDPGDPETLTRLAREYGAPIESSQYGVSFDCDGVRGRVSVPMSCPYGAPGDRLWVKETWRTSVACDPLPPTRVLGHGWPIWYAADDAVIWNGARSGGPAFTTPGKTRVSIHMPRAFSRITLEVTGVRVERLHAITEDDARAEGVEMGSAFRKLYPSKHAAVAEDRSYRLGFNQLWHEINGRESWNADPWVWVVAFRRVDAQERAP